MERGDATPTVWRLQPPHCSQHLYGKYPREVANLELWALHYLKLCWDQEAEAGGEKWCFSQVCLQTLSISDPYGEWWDCPTTDGMCCLGFLTAGFSSRGPCEVPQGFISPSYGHTGHPDHRGQHELSVSPTLPCPYGSLQPSKCAQCCW